jgi:hypothetical protein
MKKYLILLFILLSSIKGYSKKNYVLPKDLFITQFNDSCSPKRIYCFNDVGEKIWLNNIQRSNLIILLNNNKKKEILLASTKYINGIIESTEIDLTWGTSRKISIKIEDVQNIYVKPNYEIVSKYYNLDSVVKILNYMNDTLNKNYSKQSENVIYYISKQKETDSFEIVEEVCYNIIFKDKNEVYGGVIKKITKDSIYVTNTFNENTAELEKKNFLILSYSIDDIRKLSVLKSGGYTRKKINLDEFNKSVINRMRNQQGSPCWYELNPRDGEIRLYRPILCDKTYKFITEQNGHTVWKEG